MSEFQTDIDGFTIRFATPEDSALVLSLIKELAVYEKLEHDVIATVDSVSASLFGQDSNIEALIAEFNGQPVGFALFFHNFSTFLSKRGLYLEDLFVKPELRGKGFGKALLKTLAQIALERNCGRMEWAVLDWNQSAIKFYETLGAVAMNEWTVFRLTGEALENLRK